MKNSQCFRLATDYRSGSKFITTIPGNYIVVKEDGKEIIERIVPAFHPQTTPMAKDEKLERDNKKLEWREVMRRKMPGFKKRRYKYITITTVEG